MTNRLVHEGNPEGKDCDTNFTMYGTHYWRRDTQHSGMHNILNHIPINIMHVYMSFLSCFLDGYSLIYS